MKEIASKLRLIMSDSESKLKKMDSEEAILKPSPEKWSKKEILGHLIDSAANNYLWISASNTCKKESSFPSFSVRPDGKIDKQLRRNTAGVLIIKLI